MSESALANDLVPLLRELVAEVRGLRSDLQGGARHRARLRERDAERLMRLLPAIGWAIGDKLFSSRELIGFADTHLAHADELRIVLVHVLDGIDAGAGRRLGRLLARGEGTAIGGRCIRQVGAERDGAIWSVVAAP